MAKKRESGYALSIELIRWRKKGEAPSHLSYPLISEWLGSFATTKREALKRLTEIDEFIEAERRKGD